MAEAVAHQRPHTSAGTTRASSRRSLASSYLDLTPLPEDVMLDAATTRSFDSKGGSGSVISLKEEELIKKRLHERLPSSQPDNNITARPSTAPPLGGRGMGRGQLLANSSSARSARYLAIQWRSRATQLNLSKTLGDSSTAETPPSPTATSDGSESDSEDMSDSSESDVSVGTMDESIQSQVSDAQKVVEKWQQKWNERNDSNSLCSDPFVRDEEEERDRTNYSTDTLKARGSAPRVPTKDFQYPDALQFAMRPSSAEARVITNANDPVEIVSALKPYPLQAVESGREFFSESQRLKSFMEMDEEDEEDEGEHTTGVFVKTEGGRVMETLNEIEDKPKPESSTNNSNSIGERRSVGRVESFVNNDDHLSHTSSYSREDEDDDALSESSTVIQSLLKVSTGSYSNGISFDMSQGPSKEESESIIVNTFCETPVSLVKRAKPTQVQKEEEQIIQQPKAPVNAKEPSTVATPSKPPKQQAQTRVKQKPSLSVNTTKSSAKSQSQSPKEDSLTPVMKNTAKESPTKTSKAVKPRESKVSSPPKKSTTNKDTKFSGSVQERIEAVKLAKAEAAKRNKKKSKRSSPKGKNSRSEPTPSANTKEVTESAKKSKPIKWEEHNVVFTFGLLTTYKSAPPTGSYHAVDNLEAKSVLLYELMTNFGEIIRRTKSLGNGSTKYMMCSPDCVPIPVNVRRDAKYKQPANREKIKRCVVKACVPIFVPKDNVQAKEVATHVVLDLFSVAISKGEFTGLILEKVK